MHKATCVLLILVCAGSIAGLYQASKPPAYRPVSTLSCAGNPGCYPPVVRSLLP